MRGSFYGAGDEARTRYLHLGKVALYRMSYTREGHGPLYPLFRICQEKFSADSLQCVFGVSGKTIPQNLMGFLDDDKRILIPLHHQLL